MEDTIVKNIKDWVDENKKVFWKYEVSSFYQTYKINIANLPKPSNEDIKIVSNNRMLNNTQKAQLCDVIKNACARTGALCNSSINVKIDYVKGTVIAAVI